MAKNLKPSGFIDYNPEKQNIFNNLKKIIEKKYKKYGFINIETPAVENNSVLTAKGGDEVAKQIFGLYGLAQGGNDTKKYSLHFDLTVPFARYAIEYEEDIKFPFKRYQIQKVYRGERPQKCRYREFYQCDIDTIGENLSIFYDIEIIETLYFTLKEILNFLEINKRPIVHLNNKYFIEAIIDKYSIENKNEFFKLLDDYYKLDKNIFEEKLKELVGENFEEVLEILNNSLEKNLEIFKESKFFEKIESLNDIYKILKNRGVNVVFDPYITRGLDYYTGVVFETFIEGNKNLGSVCSGGRYDNLLESIRKTTNSKGKNYAGVGGSIGLSRLFCVLEENNLINKKLNLIDIIIFNLGCSNEYREKIINELKKTNKTFDVYYNKAKLDKQFKYAENKNIKYGIFAGEEEEKKGEIMIKNLETRISENIKLEELLEFFVK